MIVCSCNVLIRARIVEVARDLARNHPGRPVTAGRIFRALGARPQCGTCLTLVRRIVADAGVPFTCPEPLAAVADDEESAYEIVDGAFRG